MSTNGTPFEGVDNILLNAYTGLQLILYTNAANSLDRDTVFADLTQPSALDDEAAPNGYAAITLSGTWSSTNAVISYDHGTPDNPRFTNDGPTYDWNEVFGSVITDGTYVLHFKDFSSSRTLAPGATLDIDISSLVS